MWTNITEVRHTTRSQHNSLSYSEFSQLSGCQIVCGRGTVTRAQAFASLYGRPVSLSCCTATQRSQNRIVLMPVQNHQATASFEGAVLQRVCQIPPDLFRDIWMYSSAPDFHHLDGNIEGGCPPRSRKPGFGGRAHVYEGAGEGPDTDRID